MKWYRKNHHFDLVTVLKRKKEDLYTSERGAQKIEHNNIFSR